ncbi:MAG: L,D-transpeptidase family protein [Chitinivibrionales bacterium]|nr:L,D-transpeptidase family protein [Chitinivibrionales bacterium]
MRFVQYWWKTVTYKYLTWRRRREVDHAYAKEPAERLHVKQYAFIGVALFVAIVLGWSIKLGYAALSSSALLSKPSAPRVKVQNRAHQKRIEAAQQHAASGSAPEGVFEQPVSHPRSTIADNRSLPLYLVVANKANKVLYVLQKEDTLGWSIVKSCFMAIGQNKGPKRVAGDKKTPEGVYFITGRKERDELTDIYGPLAYVLNYPNVEDRRRGRTGQGIWIHGTQPDSLPLNTRGCLELHNQDLVELAAILKNGIGTPVSIVSNASLMRPQDAFSNAALSEKYASFVAYFEAREKTILNLVEQWQQAWQSMNISRYEQCYDQVEFNSQGLRWDAWKQRKLRTFEMYSSITVELSDIVLADYTASNAVVKFMQRYTSNLNEMENAKKLYLKNKGGSWKIVREVVIPKEELLL